MKTPDLLNQLVALGALAVVTRNVFQVRGHETMCATLAVSSEGWLTIYIEGETWGSFPANQTLEAVNAFFAVTFESKRDYAAQYVQDLLSGKVAHNADIE